MKLSGKQKCKHSCQKHRWNIDYNRKKQQDERWNATKLTEIMEADTEISSYNKNITKSTKTLKNNKASETFSYGQKVEICKTDQH